MFLSLVSWRCVSFFCSCFWGATSQQREGGQLKSCDGFFPSTRHGKLAGIPFCSKPFWWNRAAFSSLFSPIGLECLGSSCGIAPRNCLWKAGCLLLWKSVSVCHYRENHVKHRRWWMEGFVLFGGFPRFQTRGRLHQPMVLYSCWRHHRTFVMKPATKWSRNQTRRCTYPKGIQQKFSF